MRVSVIATVYNEAGTVVRLLDSLAAQTLPPDEIVLCDGGSRDGTPDLIRAWADAHRGCGPAVRLLEEAGANISRGRNLAIGAANGPLIAATDAGVRLEPTWLAELTAPWRDGPGDAVPLAAAGFFVPECDGIFETALAATILPAQSDVDPERFLPSSRSVAFTKDAWAAAGGYPEWLDYCEDLLFDFAVNRQQPNRPTAFVWRPAAVVHFRPRSTLGQFWTQYYRYARGDGKADLWRKRHALRYAVYWVALPALLGHARAGVFARWLGWLGLLVGIVAYCRRPWQRLAALGRGLPLADRLRAAALVPVLRAVGDLAKMTGYPVGLWWRYRNRRRPEIRWRDREG
jgi:glycosyltransferase involved in cell wall biosynthesis